MSQAALNMCQLISDSGLWKHTDIKTDTQNILLPSIELKKTLNSVERKNISVKLNIKQHSQHISHYGSKIYLKKLWNVSVRKSTPTFEEADQKMMAEGQAHPREHPDIFQWWCFFFLKSIIMAIIAVTFTTWRLTSIKLLL